MKTHVRIMVGIALAMFLRVQHADANQFVAKLSGSQETSHLTTSAAGTGTFTLTEEGLAYSITVDGLSGPIGAAHFHDGAMGTNGGIVRTVEFNGNSAVGLWSPSDAEPLSDDIKTDLLLGRIYLNIHTGAHAAGEIRGQVLLSSGTSFRANITPDQVAHHGGHSTPAFGTGNFTLVEEGLVYHITVNGVPGSIVGEFGMGKAGIQGPVLKTITFNGNTAEGVWHYDDAQPLTDSIEAELMSGHIYFEIGTGGYYGNEMKGQVYPSDGWGFWASANSGQETHSVTSDGHAACSFLLTERGLSYTITASGLTSDITTAHFHIGSSGIASPPAKSIVFSGNSASGCWLKDDPEAPMTTDILSALRQGNMYVELNTEYYPDGELRGQINPAAGSTFADAEMSSGTEFNAVTSPASGTGVFRLTSQGLEYHMTVDGLSSAIQEADIHRGQAGRNGTAVKEIVFNGNSAEGVWTASDNHSPLTDDDIQNFLTGNLYVNIHTTQYRDGEIRSQIIPKGGAGLGAFLTARQELQPDSSTATGTASFTLTPDGLIYKITVTGLTAPVGAAHFHYAAAGENGPIVRTIPFDSNNTSGIWRESDAEPLTDELREDLLAGEIYVNIHTSTYAAGELRGQVFLNSGTGFGGAMSTSQENHPVSSMGSGTMATTLTEEGLVYTGTVSGLTGPMGATHFHRGAPGSDGPILKTLEFSGNQISGLWKASDSEPLNNDAINSLMDGHVYVNVHTSQYAAGEIRGQLASPEIPSAVPPSGGRADRPEQYSLAQNYPNPFNPSTRIDFDMAQAGHVRLTVYDMLGRRISTLVDNTLLAGPHDVTFSAAALPSGIYFYRLEAGNANLTRRMVLLK